MTHKRETEGKEGASSSKRIYDCLGRSGQADGDKTKPKCSDNVYVFLNFLSLLVICDFVFKPNPMIR